MHKIEQEAAFQQRIVQAIHVLRHQRAVRRPIEQVRALAHHDADIGNGTLVDEMRVVLRHPVEIFASRFQPAAIFAQPILAADDVVVRRHAAGQVSLNHICASCGDL